MTENKSITQKIDELTKSTDWFYSDDFTLDEAVKKYKEAIALAKELQKDLSDLQNEVEVLAEDFQK
ncbi:exodeoxyribonuclease VII small subunit [Candidatus Saccharibacteria bacterium]|jgi:exodeoxyribonuclease VII small subunit|nr:exodeoxyribonuclease VII small subunit [Candidatus Saccharibacteria bacterium]